MANDVVVVIGAGGIGVAIARRQGFGKTVLLADFNPKILQAAADAMKAASYVVETQIVDVASRAWRCHAGDQYRRPFAQHGDA